MNKQLSQIKQERIPLVGIDAWYTDGHSRPTKQEWVAVAIQIIQIPRGWEREKGNIANGVSSYQ